MEMWNRTDGWRSEEEGTNQGSVLGSDLESEAVYEGAT